MHKFIWSITKMVQPLRLHKLHINFFEWTNGAIEMSLVKKQPPTPSFSLFFLYKHIVEDLLDCLSYLNEEYTDFFNSFF
jgi:hypothetical protein